MTRTRHAIPLILSALTLFAGPAGAEDASAPKDNITAVRSENGRYYTADDVPTFNIAKDGTVDWMTYSGFRRYHSECHVCHGPEGEGSSYAPALKNSAINLDYYAFLEVVTNGRKKVNVAEHSVMPAFGENANVMCYLDDIYTYLKARGSGALPRGRPAKKEAKSDEIRDAEKSCLGSN
ncbi:c-type cytochrome, methanol metabolism-related [Sinorhizobium terangae]|uniref:c-type cytochrome, methanol metabolism-related n=1 Tax=Sinorhizobium terangae TaxID=110322 RepID=UPI0024B25900|nr:c-type cytochrome, methanol metabolism-related [Sinorhizobium terangae]WFU50111.1 c-type cytochrome, methanol metabolism-related [Sinorhizobium terangae]